MKTSNKNIIIALACSMIVSCKQLDSVLVKNTGLTTTDVILLGVKTKDRIDLTLKEYEDAKKRNITSGKEVVTVSPTVAEAPTAENPSMLGGLLSVFGF